MPQPAITHINNYRAVDAWLATSGQPTETQIQGG